MKVNKKGNLIVAVFCLLVGLALVGTGIYYLVTGESTVTGGIIFALGIVICAMFAVTAVTMKRFEKMKAEADARYTLEQERQYRAVKEMIERIRAAEGNMTREEVAAIVAEAKRKALSDDTVPDGETPSGEETENAAEGTENAAEGTEENEGEGSARFSDDAQNAPAGEPAEEGSDAPPQRDARTEATDDE